MKNTIKIFITGFLCTVVLSGCGPMGTQNGSASVSFNAPANRSALPPQTAHRGDTNHRTTGNVWTDAQTGSSNINHTEIAKVLQNERNGLDEIENDVHEGLWANAWKTSSILDSEFHRAVLPLLKAKKGNTYADSMQHKLGALRDAVEARNRAESFKLVQANRRNLYTAARMLGVSLPK